RLKQYLDGEGHPVELINQEDGEKAGWPLALISGDKAIDEQLRGAVFATSTDPNQVVLEFASKGLHARKVLQFDPEKYLFSLETSLSKDHKEIPFMVVWQGGFGDQSIPHDPARKNAVYQADSTFKRLALQRLKDQPQDVTTLRAGVEDQYFLAMFLSTDRPLSVKVSKVEYPGPESKSIPTLVVATNTTGEKPIRVYVGPKQQEWLSKADPQLAS